MITIFTATAVVVHAQTDSGSGLTVYPSFHVKFQHQGKSYLLASTVLVIPARAPCAT